MEELLKQLTELEEELEMHFESVADIRKIDIQAVEQSSVLVLEAVLVATIAKHCIQHNDQKNARKSIKELNDMLTKISKETTNFYFKNPKSPIVIHKDIVIAMLNNN